MFANDNSKYTGPGHLAQASTTTGWLLVILILVLVGTLKACGQAGEGVSPTTWESNTITNDSITEQIKAFC